MKKEFKGFIIGFILSIIFIGTPVLATEAYEKIQVKFNAINVEVNGELVNADNILYNGTTYIPFRTVAELLNKNVEYISSTTTASITDKNGVTSSESSISYSYGKYVGDIVNNTKHGYGTMTYKNGDRYVGCFYDNQIDEGTYYYCNGDVYTGIFDENGLMDGLGEYTFANGNYYRGKFEEDTFCGFGSYYIAETGELYIGNFYNNNYYGYGFIQYDNGEVIFGYFENGKITGQYSKMDSMGNITIYELINGESVFIK